VAPSLLNDSIGVALAKLASKDMTHRIGEIPPAYRELQAISTARSPNSSGRCAASPPASAR
jgi:hypothetical protein